MIDIILQDGDINITDDGDILVESSIIQAIEVRLRWLFGEWRFNPDNGLPYLEEVLVKNPDIEMIRTHIRTQAMLVDGVEDVNVTDITIANRSAAISLTINSEIDLEMEVALNA